MTNCRVVVGIPSTTDNGMVNEEDNSVVVVPTNTGFDSDIINDVHKNRVSVYYSTELYLLVC